jgi:hypothetical protein
MPDAPRTRLGLGDVTLCMVATRAHALSIQSLHKSLKAAQFGDVLLFSDQCPPNGASGEIRWIRIPRFESISEYSMFTLRGITPYLRTSHLLITQWDGFVLHPEAWSHDFLQFDYIGAAWPQFSNSRNVGNGGFSLRSKKLLEAFGNPDIKPTHPEDISICHQNRSMLESKYGIRFAPSDIARRFSYERERPQGKTFGFHGLFNLPDFMTMEELSAFAEAMPHDQCLSRDARDLAIRLSHMEQKLALTSAQHIFNARRTEGKVYVSEIVRAAVVAIRLMRL